MTTPVTSTTNQPSTKFMTTEQQQYADHKARYLRREILQRCRQAVATIEKFAQDTSRELQRLEEADAPSGTELLRVTRLTASNAAWGTANAASELSTATDQAGELIELLAKMPEANR